MYQFITTNIINSQYALDYEGNRLVDGNGSDILKYSGSSSALKVFKVHTFLKDNIVSVYKTPYSAAVKEVATVTLSSTTSGKVYRLTVNLKLHNSTNSEYANYTTEFRKPVSVEIVGTGTAATDVATFKTELNKLKTRFGYNYFVASSSSTTLTVTANDPYQRFESIVIDEQTENSNSITQYDYLTVATGAVTTSGKFGFGDDNWMARNVMLPTAENVRQFGMSKDERPIIGGNYTQYVLRYSIDRDNVDGIVAGGKSITTHVFYVLSSLVTSFESALIAAGVVIDTVGSTVTAISITSGNLDISNALTTPYQITYTTTPTGVTGAVFTLNTADSTIAGTADWTKVTFTNGGAISLATGHGLANGDKIAVDVAIDNYTTTVEITLQS